LSFIFAADNIGLSRFIFLHWALNRVRIGPSRSSKVDDFGTNRKCICDFLLRRHSNLGHILHRFWDTVTYWLRILRTFATPLSFGAPVPVKLTVRKLLESWGYLWWKLH